MPRNPEVPEHIHTQNRHLGIWIVAGIVIGTVAGYLLGNVGLGTIFGLVIGVPAGILIGRLKGRPPA